MVTRLFLWVCVRRRVWLQLCVCFCMWMCPWTLCDPLGAYAVITNQSPLPPPSSSKSLIASLFFVPIPCIKVSIEKSCVWSCVSVFVCMDACVCYVWEGVARDNRPVEKWSVLTKITRAWEKGLFDVLRGAHSETGETSPPSVLVLISPDSHTVSTRLDFNCIYILDFHNVPHLFITDFLLVIIQNGKMIIFGISLTVDQF